MVILTTTATFLFAYVQVTRSVSDVLALTGAESSGVLQKGHSQLTGLNIRLLLLFSGAIIVISGIGYLWVGLASRQLNRPLRTISKALSRMARGKLNETVTIDAPEEFSQIATNINELAVNLQELLLYIWKQSGQCLEKLDQLEADGISGENHPMSAAHLDHIQQLYKAVEGLRNMAQVYVFYDVHLEGKRALAISEPGHPSSSGNDRPMVSGK